MTSFYTPRIAAMTAILFTLLANPSYGFQAPDHGAPDFFQRIRTALTDLETDCPRGVAEAKSLWDDSRDSDVAAAVYGLACMKAGDVGPARDCLAEAQRINANGYWVQVLKGQMQLWDGHPIESMTTLAHLSEDPSKEPITLRIFREAFWTAAPEIMMNKPKFKDLELVRLWLEDPCGVVSWNSHCLEWPAQTAKTAIFELPFSTEGGISVNVMVGSVPLRLLVDTGSEGIILTPTAASKLELKPLGGDEIVGLSGSENVTFAAVDDFAIGDMPAITLPVMVLSKPRPADFADGILGAGIFRNFDVEFDTEAMKIRIRSRRNSEGASHTIAIRVHRNGSILRISGQVAGHNAVGCLDTGNNSITLTYGLAKAMIERSGLKGTESTLDGALAVGTTIPSAKELSSPHPFTISLDTLAGPYYFSKSSIEGSTDADTANRFFSTNLNFSIGVPFLYMSRRVEIDYPHDMVYLTPYAETNAN